MNANAEYYMDSRAGIVHYWNTGRRAREIHDEHKGGKYFAGFEYREPGPGAETLMFVTIMPPLFEKVPKPVQQEPAGGAPSVPAPVTRLGALVRPPARKPWWPPPEPLFAEPFHPPDAALIRRVIAGLNRLQYPPRSAR